MLPILVPSLASIAWADPPDAELDRRCLRQGVVAADVFDAPGEDPWPAVTPKGSSVAWARVASALYDGRLPWAGAVRPEELVAALPSDDPPPTPGKPFAVRAEVARSPWEPDVAVVRIAVTARRPRPLDRPPVSVAVVIDTEVVGDPGAFAIARTAAVELAGALRDDDTLVVVDTVRGEILPPTPASDREAIRAVLEGLRVAEGEADVAGSLELAFRRVSDAPDSGGARVVLVSDGDLALVERGDELGLGLAHWPAGMTAIGFGDQYGRDEGLESLARGTGGTYLHLRTDDEARRIVGDHLGTLIEPVADDLRLEVAWGPAVTAVHRSGNHLDRLAGVGAPGGRELGAGLTAVAVYEVRTLGDRPLGDVTVRAVAPGSDTPIVFTAAIPAPLTAMDDASPAMRLAFTASAFAERLAGTRSIDRTPPDGLAALAASVRRTEYPEDAELVDLVRVAEPLLGARAACRW